MFDLSRVVAAVSVAESIAELVRATADHLRGKSVVQWKPALDEIEAAIPDVIAAIRTGTVAETEDSEWPQLADGAVADTAGDTEADQETDPEKVVLVEEEDGASDRELDARREREMGPTV